MFCASPKYTQTPRLNRAYTPEVSGAFAKTEARLNAKPCVPFQVVIDFSIARNVMFLARKKLRFAEREGAPL